MKRLGKFVNTRIGFFALLVVLFWAKTLFAYFTDFKLGAEGIVQYAILLELTRLGPPCSYSDSPFTLSGPASFTRS